MPHCLPGFAGIRPFRNSLSNQWREKLGVGPVAACFARQISDPVLRLRFLRAVMLPGQPRYPPRRPYTFWFLVSLPVLLLFFTAPASAPWVRAPEAHRPGPPTVEVDHTPEIWIVEKTAAFETYRNGLRIDNRYSTPNRPRSYLAFSATWPEDMRGQRRSVPAGIVFHSTESLQLPFGDSLLTYVRLKRAYNFLIDRFGSVYRVVPESDATNHAGNAIWADPEWLYLNLNQSFLGVLFETQTAPGQAGAALNPAQARSGHVLMEMLRKRYGIPARNCVTHAQVSVNISNLLIGYHLDWASSFPFDQFGLPDNYSLPLPAVSLFGFEYDANFVRQAGARLYQEAQFSEQVLRDRAEAAHLPVPVYRKDQQKRYFRQLAAVRAEGSGTDEGE
jgi:hypothetical protein